MISLWIALTIIYWKCSREMKCEISLLYPGSSRLTSEVLTDGSSTPRPSRVATSQQLNRQRQQCRVSRMNWRRWGPPLLCPAETRDCSAGSEDYIIFILLAYNSPLQWREKRDTPEDVIIKIFIVIIYRYRNITTLLAGRSYISINHSKLLRPQNCSPLCNFRCEHLP